MFAFRGHVAFLSLDLPSLWLNVAHAPPAHLPDRARVVAAPADLLRQSAILAVLARLRVVPRVSPLVLVALLAVRMTDQVVGVMTVRLVAAVLIVTSVHRVRVLIVTSVLRVRVVMMIVRFVAAALIVTTVLRVRVVMMIVRFVAAVSIVMIAHLVAAVSIVMIAHLVVVALIVRSVHRVLVVMMIARLVAAALIAMIGHLVVAAFTETMRQRVLVRQRNFVPMR